ncbi:MAG: hypothetical protein J6Z49_10650 [Kiritimatiellae bacterium]|nr:hypothetical protein [Kiritimatiellia bacterium]
MNVLVKVSAEEGRYVKGGANMLTAGGKFAGANVTLAAGAQKCEGRLRERRRQHRF